MHWSIRLRDAPERLLGLISLRPDDSDDQRGFWLDPVHQGKGLMFEAAERVTEFAFADLGLEALLLNNAEPNVASARIKQKQGARLLSSDPANFVSGRYNKQVWRLDCLGGVDKLAMLGEQVSLRLVDRGTMPIDFSL